MNKKAIAIIILSMVSFSVLGENYTINTFDLSPYSEKDQGIVYDIIELLFGRADLKYNIVHIPLERAIKSTSLNSFSAIAPIQRSQERETSFKWVGPIIVTETALFSREDSSIELDVLSDALKYNIIVSRGSADDIYLSDMGFKTISVNKESGMFLMIKNRRAELIAQDLGVAGYNSNKYGIKLKRELTFLTTLRSLAFNKSVPDSIIDKLNNILEDMYQDGSIMNIFITHANARGLELSTDYME